MTERIDLAAIRARLRADRDARIDTPDGEPRCALCDGEGTGETTARRTLLEHAPADLAALCDEVERLRAENVPVREIIAGRTTAPTDAEIEAHHKAGGSWLVGARTVHTMKDARWVRELCGRRASLHDECPSGWPAYRWLALGPDGAPCAWPVVATEVTS